MSNPKEELEQQKQLFKDNIQVLINNGNIEEACSLIKEYEKIEMNDIDIVNMKAIIFMIKNQLEEAEQLLWRGVEIDNKNKDLLFNLAYLFEIQGEIQPAINFYSRVMKATEDSHQKNEILNTILKLKMTENAAERKFIILSSCPWGMLQRPQYISESLTKLGYAVEYVQPPTKASAQDSNVTLNEAMQFSESNAKEAGLVHVHAPSSVYYEDNLIVDNYKEIVQGLIDSAAEEVVVICYLPSQVNMIHQLNGNFKVVYDCVDEVSVQENDPNGKSDREHEMSLLKRADIITTTSASLYLSKSLDRYNVYLLKNAVRYEDLGKDVHDKIRKELTGIPGPRVCYLGEMDLLFDAELFYNLVRQNRDKSFVVIGDDKDNVLSMKEDNLYVLNTEHQLIEGYLKNMDVGIIPLKIDNDMILKYDSTTLYKYVMNGLPVVSTQLPEIALAKDDIKVCAGLKEFNRSLNEAVKQKTDREAFRELVRENTWDARVKQLLNILDGKTKPYIKTETIKNLQAGLNKISAAQSNPIIKSLYSLTFAKSDTNMFYQLAKEAYMELKTPFTLTNYAYASFLTDQWLECANMIAEDGNADPTYKAELLFLLEHHLHQNLGIRLLHLAKRYPDIQEQVDKLEDADLFKYELAHYCFEVGNYDKAFLMYQEMLSSSFLSGSPLLNKNVSDILIHNGKLMDSQIFKQKWADLMEKYMGDKASQNLGVAMKANDNQPRFSIVIPTRNNQNTLKFTLDTCLHQQFDHFEIVVSDNSNNDNTKELIDKIADKRIKYFKPERELAMTDNFNFAVSKAKGEYIIVLGSDDGLLLHALSTLDRILYSLQTKLLRWNLVPYGWPDVKIKGYENYFQIPKTTLGNINHGIIESESLIKSVIQLEVPYNSLPMLYMNSVVHRDLITLLQEETGSVFKGISPDVYSGFALAFIEQKFVSIDLPMSIGGSSGNSNGIAHSYGKDKESEKIKQDFIKLNKGVGVNRFHILPDVPDVAVAVAESFITAKNELFPNHVELNLDRKRLAQYCAENLNRTDESFNDYLQNIYMSLDDEPGLKKWFLENYMNRSDFGKAGKPAFKYKKGFSANGALNLDASEFGITDVYGAAELFRKITGW
ncbi:MULTISPECIES: glycosyltransferase [unclassified Paenibacillus]|uniref:glycosyltransferase n=1 Tax=unclassified Paenibacillus TaxID=185978 RepID=UPI001AE808F1|nr:MULTISPECIES: glycosyltransferase [unclassified Paenibacillus]MBP1157799.1 glycosyltransferase involved in cell wall biosynthesis [Paenibacillus sp. PvP091]MBP1171465.1 glycosyltransferase involved in cell wall biosynthesis [Paenibacillus sp. PvR098]MBP2442493.1 glycosyltransferase involved in cell wall biosynthesis [Paenibacillus sp. PvP052]